MCRWRGHRPEIRLAALQVASQNAQACAVRGEGRSRIQPGITHFLHWRSVPIENGELLKLRPAGRRRRQESFAVGAHIAHAVRKLGVLTKRHSGCRERKRRRRAHVCHHYGLVGCHIIEFLAVAAPDSALELPEETCHGPPAAAGSTGGRRLPFCSPYRSSGTTGSGCRVRISGRRCAYRCERSRRACARRCPREAACLTDLSTDQRSRTSGSGGQRTGR